MRPILQIEDDVRLAAMVREYLSPHGFAITHAIDATSGLQALATGRFDAVLLDLMLPDADGLDVCRKIRGQTSIPILMLTARGDLSDRVVGLELGADDYISKPFEARELLARLRALLRRAQTGGEELSSAAKPLKFDDLVIDPAARLVSRSGVACSLTAYQFDLLCVLAQHAGRAMSREQLMQRVRGESLEAFDRSIDVHIGRIRQAIEPDPQHPRWILTLRAVGYMFAADRAAP